eukprot:363810-Chlamydomonas_euryale.AAC.1
MRAAWVLNTWHAWPSAALVLNTWHAWPCAAWVLNTWHACISAAWVLSTWHARMAVAALRMQEHVHQALRLHVGAHACNTSGQGIPMSSQSRTAARNSAAPHRPRVLLGPACIRDNSCDAAAQKSYCPSEAAALARPLPSEAAAQQGYCPARQLPGPCDRPWSPAQLADTTLSIEALFNSAPSSHIGGRLPRSEALGSSGDGVAAAPREQAIRSSRAIHRGAMRCAAGGICPRAGAQLPGGDAGPWTASYASPPLPPSPPVAPPPPCTLRVGEPSPALQRHRRRAAAAPAAAVRALCSGGAGALWRRVIPPAARDAPTSVQARLGCVRLSHLMGGPKGRPDPCPFSRRGNNARRLPRSPPPPTWSSPARTAHDEHTAKSTSAKARPSTAAAATPATRHPRSILPSHPAHPGSMLGTLPPPPPSSKRAHLLKNPASTVAPLMERAALMSSAQ